MDDPASFKGKKRYDDFELEEGDTIPPSIVGSLTPLEDLEEDEDLAELPCSICRRWIRHDLLRAHLEGHFACQAVSEPPVRSPLVADDEHAAVLSSFSAQATKADAELDLLDLLDLADDDDEDCTKSPQQMPLPSFSSAPAHGSRQPAFVAREQTASEVDRLLAQCKSDAAERVALVRVQAGMEAADDDEEDMLAELFDLSQPLPPGAWVCPYCTLRNGDSDDFSGVGNRASPTVRSTHCAGCGCEPVNGTWECEVCTHANETCALKCVACEIDRRGAEGYFDPPPPRRRPPNTLITALSGGDTAHTKWREKQEAYLVKKADRAIAQMRAREAAAAAREAAATARGQGHASLLPPTPPPPPPPPPPPYTSTDRGHHALSTVIPRFRPPDFAHIRLIHMLKAEGEMMGERVGTAWREEKQEHLDAWARRHAHAAKEAGEHQGPSLSGGDGDGDGSEEEAAAAAAAAAAVAASVPLKPPTERELHRLPVCWSPSTERRAAFPERTLQVFPPPSGATTTTNNNNDDDNDNNNKPASEMSPETTRLMACSEYETEAVGDHLLETLGIRGARIHDVRRLENLNVYRRYAALKERACTELNVETLSRTLLETLMFHGCRYIENERGICQSGFDEHLCRSGGAGHGIWLAYDSAYVDAGFAVEEADEDAQERAARSQSKVAHRTGDRSSSAASSVANSAASSRREPLRHMFVCAVLSMHVVRDEAAVRCVKSDAVYPMWLVRYRHAPRAAGEQDTPDWTGNGPPLVPHETPPPPKAPGESLAHATRRTVGGPEAGPSVYGAGHYSKHNKKFDLGLDKDGMLAWIPKLSEEERKQKEAEEHAASLHPGQLVRAIGLTGRTDLNGQKGIVSQYYERKGRWAVHFAGAEDAVLLKPENLLLHWDLRP